jgi:hypothetical protein
MFFQDSRTTVRRPTESAVYRVSPGPLNTWRVYVDPAHEIASFNDRSAAVRYAMRLARHHVIWQPVAAAAPAELR